MVQCPSLTTRGRYCYYCCFLTVLQMNGNNRGAMGLFSKRTGLRKNESKVCGEERLSPYWQEH